MYTEKIQRDAERHDFTIKTHTEIYKYSVYTAHKLIEKGSDKHVIIIDTP